MVQLAQRHVAVDFDLILRDGMSEQGLPLGIGHILHTAALVVRQRLAGIGVGGIGAADVNIGRQADVRAGGTDTDLIPAALDLPAVSSGVPVAERLVIERERDRAALPCRKRHPCKGL